MNESVTVGRHEIRVSMSGNHYIVTVLLDGRVVNMWRYEFLTMAYLQYINVQSQLSA